MDRDYFYSNETCSHEGEQSYRAMVLSHFFFEIGTIVISLVLSIAFFSRGVIAEFRKWKQNQKFKGKRKYLEMARHTKSVFLLKQLACLVISLSISSGYLLFTRFFCGKFAMVLSGAIMDSLLGLLSVLAFLTLKQPTCEQFESQRSKFSLRNSVANPQIKFLTHNFRPKKEFKPKDDGGIYVGDDGDDCSEYDEYELGEMNLCDIQIASASVATRSLRSMDDSSNPNKSFSLPSKHSRHLEMGDFEECSAQEESLHL